MKLQKEKGITLIALIVTIIILIILAGISISTLTGDNGIIDQAHTAKEDTEIASWEEQIDLAIIDAEKKHRDTTMENVIEELINKKVINDESQVDKDTGTITTNEPSYVIEDKLADYVVIYAENQLKAGDYVNYVDKNGETRLCCVLYDKSSGYGVQIITMDTVGDVSIGSEESNEEAYKEYNNAIEKLNNEAMKYMNTTYTEDARCVGSVPNDKNSDGGYYTVESDNWFYEYSGMFKNADENYKTDILQMKEVKIDDIGKYYWCASRYVQIVSEYKYNAFCMRVFTGGSIGGYMIVQIDNSGSQSLKIETKGFRPVFTLKTETQITGGEGSKEKPYTLGI